MPHKGIDFLMKRKGNKYRKRIREALQFPDELDPNIPKISVHGREEMLLENHAGVIQYTLQTARLMTGQGILFVTGEELQLCELGRDRIYIRGKIKGWGFEDEF